MAAIVSTVNGTVLILILSRPLPLSQPDSSSFPYRKGGGGGGVEERGKKVAAAAAAFSNLIHPLSSYTSFLRRRERERERGEEAKERAIINQLLFLPTFSFGRQDFSHPPPFSSSSSISLSWNLKNFGWTISFFFLSVPVSISATHIPLSLSLSLSWLGCSLVLISLLRY